MAQQSYRGYKKEQVSSMVQASAGPSNAETIQNNARRTQGILSSINSLVNSGNAGIARADQSIKEAAVKKGKIQASNGEESTAGEWGWGADEQQAAYNSVRAELVTRDMPSTIEEYLKTDKEIKKPLDEMSEDERAVAYGRARNRYFKEKGIEGSSFQEDANFLANDLQSKHLTKLNQQAVDLRQSKAAHNVAQLVAADAKSYQGNPADVDAIIDAKFDRYAVSLGGTKQAQAAVANGLLSSVMSANPSMEALRYLKSDEAKARFSSFEGFDQVVKQADTYTLKVQNAIKDQVKKQAVSGFYINLDGGAFTDEASIRGYLDQTNLEPKEKFDLRMKAMNHLKVSGEASNIQAQFEAGNYNVVNSQKPAVIEALFTKNVGNPADMFTDKMSVQQELGMMNWFKAGNDAPEPLKKFGHSEIPNGNLEKLDGMLKYYSKFKTHLGVSGTGKIFNSANQAKLEFYSKLRTDTTLSPADRKLALDGFDKRDELNSENTTFMAKLTKELSDDKLFGKDITEKAIDFAEKGGADSWTGRLLGEELQPLTTFTSMQNSVRSMDYAKDGILDNYKAYRYAGVDSDTALTRAQNDFKSQNQWVTWDEGSNKNSYVPKAFGDDFGPKAMKYLEKTNVIKAIALAENMTEEQVRKKIIIQPANDYRTTRQVAVYVDGIEKSILDKNGRNKAAFNADQFHQEQQLLDQEQLDKVIKDYSIRSQSPAFQKQQQQLTTIQSIMKGIGF